jgi:hypothetical protein
VGVGYEAGSFNEVTVGLGAQHVQLETWARLKHTRGHNVQLFVHTTMVYRVRLIGVFARIFDLFVVVMGDGEPLVREQLVESDAMW